MHCAVRDGRWNEDPFQVAKTRKHRGERILAVLHEEVGWGSLTFLPTANGFFFMLPRDLLPRHLASARVSAAPYTVGGSGNQGHERWGTSCEGGAASCEG